MGKVIRIKNDVYLANDVYRGQETLVGKWIDGKNLYKKTITFTTTIETYKALTITHGISNVDKIWVDSTASFLYEINSVFYNLPLVGYNGNFTEILYLRLDKTNITFYANGGWNGNWTKVVTLMYTKTTG